MWLVGLSYFAIAFHPSDGAFDENAKIFNKLSAIAVATLRETDRAPTSSIRRKQPGCGCADGRPASLRTRLARCRTGAIDPLRTFGSVPRLRITAAARRL
jgi:hypothetical protein